MKPYTPTTDLPPTDPPNALFTYPQVFPTGIFHVRSDGRASEWHPPRGKPIAKVTVVYNRIVVV